MHELLQIIDHVAKDMKFGSLNINLDIHEGHIKSVEGNESSQLNYRGDGTSEAMQDILQLVDQERNIERSGKLTVTFDLRQGRVKRIYVHKQFKHFLTESKK